jgi:hypothetical protein
LALLEAFGAASAMIDPSGLASAQRLRALQERRRAGEEALAAERAGDSDRELVSSASSR